MQLFNKKKKYDPSKPEFSVFDSWLNDKNFITRARGHDGCTITSADKRFVVSFCTGDGYESFLACKQAFEALFAIMVDNLTKSKRDQELLSKLFKPSYWDCQIFIKAWDL